VPTDDEDLGSAATIAGTLPDVTTPTQSSLPGSRDSSPVIPPSVIADRYEILGLLGVGGMGRVYRAHDRALDEQVALKLLKKELVGVAGMLDRFRQEVKLARRVTSPHVVRTFDLGEHAGEHFLTMEIVEGRSLAQLLDDGQLSVDEILRISRAMAAGISAAHATGVTHRDLKPDNVLVGKDGRIAITDFGIARAAAAAPRDTVEGFIGTPAYMAPEQVDNSSPIGPATDVYAFGAILFEMLAGRRPFVGNDVIAVAVARLREAPPDPRLFRRVPDALAELTLRCLSRDAALRFTDGGELAKALAAISTDGPSTLVNASPYRVPTKTSRSVAILPLRATGELAEIADGLSEEIVDALSLTRELRVRPLVSLRNSARADQDSRDIGKSLGVDVVVDGSIRKRGAAVVRIAARVIGVEDGFQLWANHFDTAPDDLLTASDQVVRAIANVLTVELAASRPKLDAKVQDVYLESKAKLRTGWMIGGVDDLIEPLETAHASAPDDVGVVGMLALVHARSAFYGGPGKLPRARLLAERATKLAPSSGEAWLSLGVCALYENDMATCTHALIQAVSHAPGLAMAQALLGSVCLEAGHLPAAIAHLEGAHSLDPSGSQISDLPRAYIYDGREADAMHMLALQESKYRLVSIARFKMWKGETFDVGRIEPTQIPDTFTKYAELAMRVHRTRQLQPGDREVMDAILAVDNFRLRAIRAQFLAEFLAFVGDFDGTLQLIETAVAAGFQDHLWMQRCPLLDSVRERPRFAELAATVAERARRVLDAIDQAERPDANKP
jgi:serine/threonine-protein kinase